MKQSKWHEFQNSDDYEIVDLGRPFVFLVPIGKLQSRVGPLTLEQCLTKFLSYGFEAFTKRSGIRGRWKGHVDDLVEYEVSFLGKDKIPMLLKKLTYFVKTIGEECFYIKAGQYTGLLKPKK